MGSSKSDHVNLRGESAKSDLTTNAYTMKRVTEGDICRCTQTGREVEKERKERGVRQFVF